jgi:hypothetical protein
MLRTCLCTAVNVVVTVFSSYRILRSSGPFLVGYHRRLRAAPLFVPFSFFGAALFRAGAWVSIRRGSKAHGPCPMVGVCRHDSGALGPGLCSILDIDFRERPFPDVGRIASTTYNDVPHGERIHPLRVCRTTMCGIHITEPGAYVRHSRRTTPPFPFPPTPLWRAPGSSFYVVNRTGGPGQSAKRAAPWEETRPGRGDCTGRRRRSKLPETRKRPGNTNRLQKGPRPQRW